MMPVIFFGHGNPMNALSDNAFSQGWKVIGQALPRPKAILAISAHWYIPRTAVTAHTYPPTLHDFGGFPKELFAVEYPAPGDLELAKRVQDLLTPIPVSLDESWGLDHGTWSVLRHVFPNADIPVVQLSIDSSKPPAFHYELGKRLKPLREEGVLIIGSGNIVHNLAAYAWENPALEAYDWALRFERQICLCLAQEDDESLLDYQQFGQDALLSVPTLEHYLPLLYILGLSDKTEPLSFPIDGFEGGAISMLSVKFGEIFYTKL